MSQQQEQNKTAKQWLKDRGFVVETVEQAFDFDRQAQQLEEYASQQTASLQKQVDELKKERDEIQYHFNSHDYEIELLEKQAEEDKSRITQLEEALKHLLNLPLPEYARREIKQALNPTR